MAPGIAGVKTQWEDWIPGREGGLEAGQQGGHRCDMPCMPLNCSLGAGSDVYFGKEGVLDRQGFGMEGGLEGRSCRRENQPWDW